MPTQTGARKSRMTADTDTGHKPDRDREVTDAEYWESRVERGMRKRSGIRKFPHYRRN